MVNDYALLPLYCESYYKPTSCWLKKNDGAGCSSIRCRGRKWAEINKWKCTDVGQEGGGEGTEMNLLIAQVFLILKSKTITLFPLFTYTFGSSKNYF